MDKALGRLLLSLVVAIVRVDEENIRKTRILDYSRSDKLRLHMLLRTSEICADPCTTREFSFQGGHGRYRGCSCR